MLHIEDLIQPGPEQILLTRLSPFPWPHLVPHQIVPGERITNQVCKESPSASPISGKFDYISATFPDSKSMTWGFFTAD
jgi:hypothetical protein